MARVITSPMPMFSHISVRFSYRMLSEKVGLNHPTRVASSCFNSPLLVVPFYSYTDPRTILDHPCGRICSSLPWEVII